MQEATQTLFVQVPVQVPQLTVLETPQLSFAVTLPQFLPNLVQNAESDSCVQVQILSVQVSVVHVPQFTVLETPQLSFAVTLPQFLPSLVQNAVSDSSVQPEHTPLEQVSPVPQLVTGPKSKHESES